MILGTFFGRNFTPTLLCGFISVATFSCTKPNELEAVTPEASGTVAAPSGSPVVTQVNSSTTDGAYKAGDVISVRVTFGLAATVTGTPRVLLETGNTDRYATYVSGSGGVTLEFSYTVQAGDTSSDLSYVNINSLELNGGTISAPDATAMSLVLPGLGASGSLSVNRALVIDTTAPIVAGAVTDGTYYNSTTSSPNLTWAAGTDTGGSGIAKYQVAVGTTSGGTQTLTWTDIGNVTTYQVTAGITLTNGTTYYPSIRAVDAAGNASTPILGDGWIVDTTPPTSPTVNDGGDSYNSTQTNLVTWTASTDAASGLAKYEFAIGTTAGGTDVLTWTDVALVTSYRRTGLVLTLGTTYYVSVRASDVAGNSTIAQGDGWTIVACDTYGWCPQAYLKAANAEAYDNFGWAVAVSGDTVVVGAREESSNQTTITNGPTASADNSAGTSGAVYVYKRTGNSWAQEAYLKAPNAEAGDRFGTAVAIGGDTIVVGAYREDSNQTTITNGTTASANNTSTDTGAAYVFKRTGSTWAQEAYLKSSNAVVYDYYGSAVAISGDTIVVGAEEEDSNQTTIINGTTGGPNFGASKSGAAFVYKRTGTTWAQQAYLKASNAEADDRYGKFVGISGDTIIVGAYNEDSNQTTITNGTTSSANNSLSQAGAVYVYKRTGVNWAQEAYLKAAKLPVFTGDLFGLGIGIDGDTIAVAAHGDDSDQTIITNGTGVPTDDLADSSGAVYVFKRTGTTWAQEAYLKAPNSGMFLQFGDSIVVSGDTIAVGTNSEGSNQTTVTNGATLSSGGVASDSGAVYVFKRTGVNWAHEAYLKASNAEANDWFGNTIGIDGDTIVVGAHLEDSSQTTITNGATASNDNSAAESGAAYVFTRNNQATWQQQAYVKAPNAEAGDSFGSSVAISGDTLVVGASGESSNQTTITNGSGASSDNSMSWAGAVYVFKRTDSSWAQEAYVKTPNMGGADFFGSSLSVDGDTFVAGVANEDSNQTTITNGTTASSNDSLIQSGAAYVFKRTGTTWAQEAYLKAPNAEAYDEFGSCVSISRDTIVVGARAEDSNQTTITNGTTASANNSATQSGAAYVFKRTGTTWAQEAYIKAPNAHGGDDSFGVSCFIDQDTIVVGAYQEDSNQTTITNGTTASADNTAVNAGAAYVFKRTGVNWAQEAYLKAPNAEAGDEFGLSVAIHGDTLIVGAAKEDSNQTTVTNGTTASSDNSAADAGAAYIFKRTGTTWAPEAYLKAPNAEAGDGFGRTVSIYGDYTVVGAFGDDSNQTTITDGPTASSDNSAADSGAVYVFKRNGTNWTQEAYIKAPNAETNDYFSYGGLAIHRNTIAVGAYMESSNQTTITNGTTASSDNSAPAAGAVYIFKR